MVVKRSLAVALIFVLLLGSGAYFFRSFIFGSLFGSEYEEPLHEVVLKDGNIEIRRYESYVLAEVTVAGSFDRATSGSFGPLFRYISGANRSRENVKMTAPVLVEPTGSSPSEELAMTVPVLVEPRPSSGDAPGRRLAGEKIDAWTMAFVLPAGYTAETAPLPTNESVSIRQVEEHEVASIRFSGRLSNESAERQRAQLADWLQARGLEHQGDWRIATYDPPFTIPWFRRNEVLVTLR
ncbi:MAG: heme-binding protein [Chloroflexota bacterium]|nr:heme-binding protein [Chloroflexota bacterium]MDE2929730.1 heme-binding protein [Chloroflexota bacterium]